MRINHPVVDREYPFPVGETLVSTTDLKGRILYCNPAFITVSGYMREELLGQPHNMIRHPDMPEEAFRDMWQTIASGQPWSALVKNRRKDGSHYWVRANVTPLMVGDRPSGYMSVRTEASRADIESAKVLYAQLNQEKSQGVLRHQLRAGRVVRAGWQGKLGEALRMDLIGQMTLTCLVVSMASMAAGMAMDGNSATWRLSHLLSGLAGAIGISLLARWWIHGLTMAPMRQLLTYANRMAAGDLTTSVGVHGSNTVGQLAKALNQLNVNLRSIVRDARSEVDQMLDATREIASGNLDLSGRTEAQASSLQQTAASMEQITGTVRSSADIATEASRLATRTTEITQRSSEAVLHVTETMKAIQQSSGRISDIIQVIDSIAFQTNILALNAAVEAARAGEQGRGFAVVAAEVRALAQRTATAAKEVKQLITDSADKVTEGGHLTDKAQATMLEALSSVQQVSALVDSITHGVKEQLTGISQINEAVAQLDSITQQNAAAVEQISASSMALATRAQVVSDTVQVFRIDDKHDQPKSDAIALRRQVRLSHKPDQDSVTDVAHR